MNDIFKIKDGQHGEEATLTNPYIKSKCTSNARVHMTRTTQPTNRVVCRMSCSLEVIERRRRIYLYYIIVLYNSII